MRVGRVTCPGSLWSWPWAPVGRSWRTWLWAQHWGWGPLRIRSRRGWRRLALRPLHQLQLLNLHLLLRLKLHEPGGEGDTGCAETEEPGARHRQQ